MNILPAYKALADESRMRLVHILNFGSFNVQELTRALDLSQSTISHHLKILAGAELVESRREGTWIYYSLLSSADSETGSASQQISADFIEVVNSGVDPELTTILHSDSGRIQEILGERREKARTFFEAVADEWSTLRNNAFDSPEFVEKVTDLIPTDANLLDLGCGSGALLEKVLPRHGTSIGVDFSQAMLDAARKNLGRHGEDVELRLGKLEHLPIGDETIDVAVGYMVFHHIPEPAQALKDAYRVLKPGGTLIVVDLTPHSNEKMRDQFADLWLGFKPEKFSHWVSEEHFTGSEVSLLGENSEAFLLTATKGN